MTDLAPELAEALSLEDETERKLAVVALIDELVQRIGFRAIVIGGLAVEFWTQGEYSTADIDLYVPHGPAVDDLLAELGFEKRGRHWVIEEHELFVEAPASVPADASLSACSTRTSSTRRISRGVWSGKDSRRLSASSWSSPSGSIAARRSNRGSFRRSRGSSAVGENALMRRIRFVDWLRRREAGRRRVERIERGFAESYRRERPRDPEEARLLRERGTPERLIGPTPDPREDDR